MVKRFHILLVNPACQDKRITDDDAKQIPIGIYYIAALLIQKGYSVNIVNLADIPDNFNQAFEQSIKQAKPDLVGFSVTNPSRMNAMACATQLKRIHADVPVVFGGPAPTFLAKHLFDACPAIDFIVKGEGEQTFLELVQELDASKPGRFKSDNLKPINGLIYRNGTELVETEPRPPIENLDSLPHPSRYFAFNHLSMSRGCPGKCTFCGSPKFWTNKKVRFHSPEWMIQELKTQVKRGISHFFISDDTFTMDKERVMAFCSAVMAESLPITWNAISRVDYIDADILLAMRKAGCIQISYGVESGSPRIRKTLGKPVNETTIIQAFEQTVSFGILPRAYFIYGAPGETDESIQDTLDLMSRIKPLGAIFYMLVIFPGTHLYHHATLKGKVSNDIWKEKIEDLPWFEIDESLNFQTVKTFGQRLRDHFHSNLTPWVMELKLNDNQTLYPFHADFLSRLAMTFSHGEYANHKKIKSPEKTAHHLYKKALDYAPNARAFLGQAMLFQKQRQFPEAIQTLTNSFEYFKDDKDLNICMGICLMNTGQFSGAIPYFEKFESSTDAAHYLNICREHI